MVVTPRRARRTAPAAKSRRGAVSRQSQAQRRARTEQRIIEAFGRIVARDGLYNVRVNYLMREAGVGKRQLYQYFGGLAGVAGAWSRAGMQVPSAPPPPTAPVVLSGHSPAGKLSRVLQRYAESLRGNPVAIAAVQSQLAGPAELTDSLREVRKALREEQIETFLADPRLREDAYVALYSVLYAAINYCALRGASALPAFNGLNLAKEQDWQRLLGMFRTVAGLVEKGLGGSTETGQQPVRHARAGRKKQRSTGS